MIDSLFGIHYSSWQDSLDTRKSPGCYIHFIQVEPVDFSTYVPNQVAMSSSEFETKTGANACMALQCIRMLQKELDGIGKDMRTEPPILMLCDNNGAVIIAKM